MVGGALRPWPENRATKVLLPRLGTVKAGWWRNWGRSGSMRWKTEVTGYRTEYLMSTPTRVLREFYVLEKVWNAPGTGGGDASVTRWHHPLATNCTSRSNVSVDVSYGFSTVRLLFVKATKNPNPTRWIFSSSGRCVVSSDFRPFDTWQAVKPEINGSIHLFGVLLDATVMRLPVKFKTAPTLLINVPFFLFTTRWNWQILFFVEAKRREVPYGSRQLSCWGTRRLPAPNLCGAVPFANGHEFWYSIKSTRVRCDGKDNTPLKIVTPFFWGLIRVCEANYQFSGYCLVTQVSLLGVPDLKTKFCVIRVADGSCPSCKFPFSSSLLCSCRSLLCSAVSSVLLRVNKER